jgi:hypothetical protein
LILKENLLKVWLPKILFVYSCHNKGYERK